MQGARRVPHGPVRADGLHRQRRELRGHASRCSRASSSIRATSRRSRSAGSSRRDSSARSRAAATTTIAHGAVAPEPTTDPALGLLDLRARARDADQRGGRRRAHARRVARGHRSRDDEGGELPQGPARVGRTRSGSTACSRGSSACRASTARTAIVRARCCAAWCATSGDSSNERRRTGARRARRRRDDGEGRVQPVARDGGRRGSARTPRRCG